MDPLQRLQQIRLPFADLLGIRYISATNERVTAEMLVRPELCTSPEILHGGAIMAFADTLGAAATVLNLRDGQGTTTLESKTNFLAPALVNTTVTGETTAVHRGRRTMVWTTTITNQAGRKLAVVTQTQMVLEASSA